MENTIHQINIGCLLCYKEWRKDHQYRPDRIEALLGLLTGEPLGLTSRPE